MARTALLYLFAATLVATGWLRLEDGPDAGAAAALVLLALVPALLRPWWGRAGAALVALLVAAQVVFGRTPLDARPFDDGRDFFGPLASRFAEGFLQFYDVPQPFAVPDHPGMHEVVLTAIFGFCLALGLAIAARRPLVASAILLGGSIWPATLVPGADLERGALSLVAVLALLALGGRGTPRSHRPALAAGTVLVALAVGASTSSAVAKDAFVDWRGWDPYDEPADPVGVDYVWNASYRGIEWPEEETTVLTVEGPTRKLYWRATTLDDFQRDRWLQNVAPVYSGFGRFEVFDDMLPQRAHEQERWVEAKVTIRALRDEHLVGPSMPVAYEAGRDEIGLVEYRAGGVAVVPDGLDRGDTYTVWSYAPRPTPKELAAVRPTSPGRSSRESRYLEVAPGLPTRPFGASGREAHLENLFTNERYAARVRPYRPLYEAARAIVGTPRNQYAAVVALESWFRSEGGFRYDEQPPFSRGGAPPLVDFVLDHKRGYCQLYAGSMALMLRYLGIPARVAAGFLSGDPNEESTKWTVTDRDAHAWVEVWFSGWGWLPFDPTPARGQLSNPYSYTSPTFDFEGAAEALGGAAATGYSGDLVTLMSERKAGEGREVPGGAGVGVSTARERGASLVRLLLLVAAAVAASIALGKAGLRRSRYATRDPRRLAAACRSELVDVLADQGVRLSRASTPRELRAELERFAAVDAEPFAAALEAARYGPPGEARSAARRARRELRRLRRRLRTQVGVPARLRGAVSLRSLAA